MKKKTKWRDWFALLAFGLAGEMIYRAALVVVPFLNGFIVGTFTKIEWYIGAFISYLGIRLVIEIFDLFYEARKMRCPICRQKIKTNRPIKCEECGGAAQLASRASTHRSSSIMPLQRIDFTERTNVLANLRELRVSHL